MTYKQHKRLSERIEKICEALDIDKSVALHFLNIDLERIYNDNIHINDIRLSELESEIKKNIKTETELKQEIEKKETLIKNNSATIDNLSISLKEKITLLSTQQEKIIQLQSKLNDLKGQLTDTDKKKKILEYDIMMKSHSIKESNDKSYRYLKIFLTITTIIAIILFLIKIYKK